MDVKGSLQNNDNTRPFIFKIASTGSDLKNITDAYVFKRIPRLDHFSQVLYAVDYIGSISEHSFISF